MQRLTASAVFHVIRILCKYVDIMTDSVRIYELPINESLKLDALRECLCIRRSPAAAGAVVNGSSAVTAAAV